jgi:hypothetical protein
MGGADFLCQLRDAFTQGWHAASAWVSIGFKQHKAEGAAPGAAPAVDHSQCPAPTPSLTPATAAADPACCSALAAVTRYRSRQLFDRNALLRRHRPRHTQDQA